MRVKRYVYITNPEVGTNPDKWRFAISDFDDMDTWLMVGVIKFDVDVDSQKLIDKATGLIDKELGKHTAAINVLEQKKAELLALPELKSDHRGRE